MDVPAAVLEKRVVHVMELLRYGSIQLATTSHRFASPEGKQSGGFAWVAVFEIVKDRTPPAHVVDSSVV